MLNRVLCAVWMIALPISIAMAEGDVASSSLLVRQTPAATQPEDGPPHALRQLSLFAVAPPMPRMIQQHDLVQIIVREQSQARSSQELDTKKQYKLDGKIARFPQLDLSELLQLRVGAGRVTDLPELKLDLKNDFKGDGDYRRRDDLSARITAEVIEVLPNGNLILEARTHIKTDKEEAIMKVTGVCRSEDVTAANTVLSNQLHNLTIEKVHQGELRRTTEKGIIAKVFDVLFAF